MGISEIVPNQYVYTQKIHRDIRTFDKGSRLWINTLIMLDDSTEENGATWLLEGSHLSPNKPDEENFYKNSKDLQVKQVTFFCLMEMRGMLLAKTLQRKKSNCYTYILSTVYKTTD